MMLARVLKRCVPLKIGEPAITAIDADATIRVLHKKDHRKVVNRSFR